MNAIRVSDITEELLSDLRREGTIYAWELDMRKHSKNYSEKVSISNIEQTVILYDKHGKKHTGNTDEYIVVNNNNIAVISHEAHCTMFPVKD